RGLARKSLFELAATLRDGIHDEALAGLVLRAVHELDGARRVLARDGVERLLLEEDELVGVALGARDELRFLRLEAQLLQARDGHVAVPIRAQLLLERIEIALVPGGGVRAHGGGEAVAAGCELLAVVEHLPAR